MVKLIIILVFASSTAVAHGVVNGGRCYNDWHYYNGVCHQPTSILAIILWSIGGIAVLGFIISSIRER